MNALTKIVSQTMSSREIAELCNKRHDNVMSDIRKMLFELNLAAPDFSGTAFVDGPNNSKREIQVFNLPKREILILVSGYSVELRAKIIDRWEELESGLVKSISTKKKRESFNLGSVTRQCVIMANALGLKGNQAILSADRAVQKLTGQSPMELLGVTHLHAPVQEQTLTPTQIGKSLPEPISAQKVNIILEEMGMQQKPTGCDWLLTDKGKIYGEILDTGKKHSNGTPVKQVKWYSNVVSLINEHLSSNSHSVSYS